MRKLAHAALVACALLTTGLWLAGLRSSSAAVAHGLLIGPSSVAAVVALALALRARRWPLAAAALAVLCPAVALSAIRSIREARPEPEPSGAKIITLLTYNLLFSARGEGTPARLRDADADIVCLQEVTPAWSRRLAAAFSASHPYSAVEARAGAYGAAIYSRLPLSLPTLVRDRRRVAGQCVAVAPNGQETVLCNVHLSSPAGVVGRGARWLRGFDANARVRAAQWALLREHVTRTYPRARHLIVAGDFNTLESEPLYRVVRRELVDAFAAVGRGRGATFPAEPTSPLPLVRIDYVFASPALAPVAAEVLPPSGSDHLGLRAALALAGR